MATKKAATDVVHPERMKEMIEVLEGNLKSITGEKKGVVLLVFDFGPGGNLQYISNGNRQDVMAALRELLAKWSRDGRSAMN